MYNIHIYIYLYNIFLRTDLQDRCAHDMHTDGFMCPCCVFQSEDVVAVKSTGLQSTGNTGEYVVLRKCPAESAARLRVSEKHFVADHALLLAQRFGRGPCLDNSTSNVGPPEMCENITTVIGQVPAYNK